MGSFGLFFLKKNKQINKLSQPILVHMKSTLLEPSLSSEKGFRKGYCNKLVNLYNYTLTNMGHF